MTNRRIRDFGRGHVGLSITRKRSNGRDDLCFLVGVAHPGNLNAGVSQVAASGEDAFVAGDEGTDFFAKDMTRLAANDAVRSQLLESGTGMLGSPGSTGFPGGRWVAGQDEPAFASLFSDERKWATDSGGSLTRAYSGLLKTMAERPPVDRASIRPREVRTRRTSGSISMSTSPRVSVKRSARRSVSPSINSGQSKSVPPGDSESLRVVRFA